MKTSLRGIRKNSWRGRKTRYLPTNRPNIILVVGIQGSGKTTSIGKLGRLLVKKGYRVGVIAADTFRPGAITELKTICNDINVPVFSIDDEKNSVKVAKIGVDYFREQNSNVIIVDTAGRHKEEKGLFDEMKQISGALNPDFCLPSTRRNYW